MIQQISRRLVLVVLISIMFCRGAVCLGATEISFQDLVILQQDQDGKGFFLDDVWLKAEDLGTKDDMHIALYGEPIHGSVGIEATISWWGINSDHRYFGLLLMVNDKRTRAYYARVKADFSTLEIGTVDPSGGDWTWNLLASQSLSGIEPGARLTFEAVVSHGAVLLTASLGDAVVSVSRDYAKDGMNPDGSGKVGIARTGWRFGVAGWRDIRVFGEESSGISVVAVPDVQHWEITELRRDLAGLKIRGLQLDWLSESIDRLCLLYVSDVSAFAEELRSVHERLAYCYEAIGVQDTLSEIRSVVEHLGLFEHYISQLESLEAAAARYLEIVQVPEWEAVEIQRRRLEDLLTETWAALDSVQIVREGVSKYSYGRFGWFTGSNSGWVIGDGTLANQVTENALVREYVFTGRGTVWRMGFGVTGQPVGSLDVALDKSRNAPLLVADELVFHDPSVSATSRTSPNCIVDDISWVHKSFWYRDLYRVTMSVVNPAVLIESGYNQFYIEDARISAYSHMAFVDEKGEIRIVPLHKGFSVSQDGKFGENWLLLWADSCSDYDAMGNRGSIPLQLIFLHQPERIQRTSDGRIVFTFPSSLDAIWLNTPLGVRVADTAQWKNDLDNEVVSAVRFWSRVVLAYPNQCVELYKESSDNPNQIEVTNVYRYTTRQDEWGTRPLRFAPIPPLLSFALRNGYDGSVEEVIDVGYPTLYGPLEGSISDTVTYSLSVPQYDRVGLVYNSSADSTVVSDLNWKIQTEFRRIARVVEGPWGFNAYVRPASLIARPLMARSYWSDATTKLVSDQANKHIETSFERRYMAQWMAKIEPYSGRKYYYSFSLGRDSSEVEGNGSDVGYGIGLHLYGLDMWASYFGQWKILADLWGDTSPLSSPETLTMAGDIVTVRNMMGYYETVNDWAWMSSGANQYGGNGPVVDVAQTTYLGYVSYTRMAEALGKQEDVLRGRYLVSRALLSLVYRQAFNKYAKENGIIGPDDHIVGFREESKAGVPHDHFGNSMLANRYPSDIDYARRMYLGTQEANLSLAWGVDLSAIWFPYFTYALEELREWEYQVGEEYWPNRYWDTGWWIRQGSSVWATARYLSSGYYFRLLDGEQASRYLSTLKRDISMGVERLMTNWTVYESRWSYEITPAILSAGCPLVLTRWDPLPFPKASFDMSQKLVTVELLSVPEGYQLIGLSNVMPKEVTVNDEILEYGVDWTYDPQTYRILLRIPAGSQCVVKLHYEEVKEERFEFIAVPRD